MTLTALALLATFFGVLMGASPLLQALKTHRKKSNNDVSLFNYFTAWRVNLA
jgi:hypothetical protein